jgi:site-specific recombinase XerD
VPALIAAAGWRYVEFFTANIRNPNTRRAYARACARCRHLYRGASGDPLGARREAAARAVRMMFDWLIVGHVAASNPASAVRGPKHVVKTGKTPVLEGKEWRRLIDTIPTDTVRDPATALIALAAGIMAPIGNHSFRATGITAYLANGGALEHAQAMAAHESPRTTKLYDRTNERLTQDEVERIRL